MYKCEICKKEFTNTGAHTQHYKTCKKITDNFDEICKLYVDDLWSINQIKEKFNIGANIVSNILGDKKRTLSESIKIAHKKYPEKFKHSEKTKQFLREKRLDYMKKNPEKTAWRTKNLSYPEKIFLNKLNELEWGKKYSIKREYSFFPYFIDFAFLNEKVAVEIDGSQHLLPERKKRDNEKDELLISSGWTIVRIAEHKLKTEINAVFNDIEKILNKNKKPKKYKVGIVLQPKNYQKIKREKNGLTKKQYESILSQRKVERPDYNTLISEVELFGYTGTGKKYGVSDNTIRKWIKFYEKYK
jgi:very-short-patch-repair endonuclease